MELPRGTFGRAIKNARNAKKLTQEKLAEMIGITPAHMKQIESERRNASVEVLFKLVNALDLSLDFIFSNSDDDKQELAYKINLCLDRCSVHELQVVYATIEAMLNKSTE